MISPYKFLHEKLAMNKYFPQKEKTATVAAIHLPEEGEQEHDNMMMAELGQQSSSLKNTWPGHVLPELPSSL